MELIVLDEEFPYPLNTGKRIRTFNLISRLAKEHNIRYVAYGEEHSEAAQALRQAQITPVAVAQKVPEKSGLRFYYRLAKNLLSPLPYIVDSHYSGPFKEAIARAIGERRPDLLLAEWSPYALYAQAWPEIRHLIVAHNVESHIWRRYYETESNALKRWYIGVQYRKVENFERLAFARADAATAVSAKESAELLAMNHALAVETIDNGVDLEYFAPVDQPEEDDTLVFTGSMDWRPNQDAADYFARDILPVLKVRRPSIRAIFVGRNPPPHVRELEAMGGIEVTGTVDDVRPYIARASVYIVPLRVGGGSRLKILEALSMAKGIVSTTVGAEGLEVIPGNELLLADTPETFAHAVLSLIDNRSERRKLGQAGRELVQRRYGWDSLAARLDQFIRGVVKQ